MRSSIALCLTALLFHTALAIAAPVPLPPAHTAESSLAGLQQPNNTPGVGTKYPGAVTCPVPTSPGSSSASDDAKMPKDLENEKNPLQALNVVDTPTSISEPKTNQGCKANNYKNVATESWAGGTYYSGMKKLRRRS